MNVPPSRDAEIRLIWKENQWLYMVVGFIAGLLFCLLTQLSVLNLPELVKDLLPEATGILVTITVIDQLNRRRDTRNANQQLKQRLIIQMGSTDNGIALHGLAELQARGWVQDGSLQEAKLEGAKLQRIDLTAANLQEAKLLAANLQGAKLMRANLQMATLLAANLQGAKLMRANLQKANLGLANLQGADLRSAKLQGADLTAAKLQGADLMGAEFDEATILPDRSHWTPATDMTRFTHPDSAAETPPNDESE